MTPVHMVYIRILDIHKPTHLYVIVSVGSPATVYSRGVGGGGGGGGGGGTMSIGLLLLKQP